MLSTQASSRLKELRETLGYKSARKFAIDKGIAISTYTQHENGAPLKPKSAEKYAKIFNVTPEWLLTGKFDFKEKIEHELNRKRRYLGRYFAHPMMQNRRAKRDDYKPSAVRVTQRCVP
ncbi:helix-turn-helix domain-containing protein [Piscirickettsia salmonis]|uniref:helix-turn-helix domain-containing protein n=1 Tax=Piscirickettsia salmonis TaxID=1238 RepID=UPI0007C8C327|nr:Helix-turn-helix domain protein [Piscirickettsiaceae bacterium NZ-RLO1]